MVVTRRQVKVESESPLYRFYMNYPDAADINVTQSVADVGTLDYYMECSIFKDGLGRLICIVSKISMFW